MKSTYIYIIIWYIYIYTYVKLHNIPYDTIIRIVYIPSDNGWLGDPTHGNQAFPSRPRSGDRNFFLSVSRSWIQTRNRPGHRQSSWRKITRNVGYQHVPTILPDQREKWGTLFGTSQEGTWRNTLIVSECPRFVGVFPYSNSSSLCFRMNYYIGW